jgi:hypothetical protein
MSPYGKVRLTSLGGREDLNELAGSRVNLLELIEWLSSASHWGGTSGGGELASGDPDPGRGCGDGGSGGGSGGGEDRVAEETLAVLTASAVRKGSLDQMELEACREDMLDTLRRCISAGKPIQLTLMAFPFKVPNPAKVGSRTMPDLAELTSILRLCHLREKIEACYEPGLEVHLIHDGSYIADIFGVDREEVRLYEAYLKRLIEASGADDFIHTHDFLDLLRARHTEVQSNLARMRKKTLQWWRATRDSEERRERFRKTLGMINLRDLSSEEAEALLEAADRGRLEAPYREVEARVHHAMRTYHLRDAILHEFDPRPRCFPDAIHATSQERPRRLALWLVRRGESRLPWHGVGLIDEQLHLRVTLHTELRDDDRYRTVFLEDEDTPFFRVEMTSS